MVGEFPNRAPGPVSDAVADSLLAPLRRYQIAVLAVSGGSDSMALLELAGAWRRRLIGDKTMIVVATVDHRLRAESVDEAAFVAARAVELGLRHDILPWLGEKPISGLAAAARNARYSLLHAHATRLGGSERPLAIVTAHTLDDQAETVIMRLARGSGVDGLAAMAEARPLEPRSNVDLVRPLLAVPKSHLVATLEARGRPWREDPSNADVRSERSRIRRSLADPAGVGFEAKALALTARRMGEARDAIAYGEAAFAATLLCDFNNEAFASFDRAAFDNGPVVLRRKFVERLIARFGGATPAPEAAELADLIDRMRFRRQLRATLGGAVVDVRDRIVKVWREVGRLNPRPAPLPPGARMLWDNRFWLLCYGADDVELSVRALGADGRRLRPYFERRKLKPPAGALATLPGIWIDDTLIAAPPYDLPMPARLTVAITAAADESTVLKPFG